MIPGRENEATEFTYIHYLNNDNENVIRLIRSDNKIIFTCGKFTADVSVQLLLEPKPLGVLLNNHSTDFSFKNNFVNIKLEPGTETVLEIQIK